MTKYPPGPRQDAAIPPRVVEFTKTYKPVIIGEIEPEKLAILKALANFQADIEQAYDPDNLQPNLFPKFVSVVIAQFGPLPRDPLPTLKRAWGELGFNSLRPALLSDDSESATSLDSEDEPL